MRRVFVITDHLEEDPCYRLRIKALIEPLAQRGIQLDVHLRPKGFFKRRRIMAAARGYDAAILNYKMLDPGEYRLLRACVPQLFFDLGDAVWQLATPQSFFTRLRLRRRFNATVRFSTHIVAGNQHVADSFRQKNQDLPVTIVPTVVNPADYSIKTHVDTVTPQLVWIGTTSTLPYLADIFPALSEAQKTIPNLRLRIICDKTLQGAPIPVDFLPWSLDTEAAHLLAGDIGIAPTPLNPWTLGKSGFKLIQYMATGLPVIASPVGANATIVQVTGGEPTGFLPTTQEAWVQAISALAHDPARRNQMGNAGRRRVETVYGLEHIVSQWAKLLA